MSNKINVFILMTCFLCLINLPAFSEDNVILQWNQTTLDCIKNTMTAPPIASRALAIVHTAIFDAGIAAWDAKIAYDSVSPITAIRFLFKGKKIFAWGGAGQGTKLINGED